MRTPYPRRIKAAARRTVHAIAGLLAFTVHQQVTAEVSGPVIIRDATIIDGTGAPPRRHLDLLLEGGRITAIGSRLKAPRNAQVIRASGKYVMPGLIDTHVHFQFPVTFQLTPAEEKITVEHGPKAYLYNGVTSVLDAGATSEFIFPLRQAQREGRIVGPRIYAVGPGVTPEKGWGSRHGRALRDVAAVEERIRSLVALHSDGVKLIVEDGLGHSGTHLEISDDMLNAAANGARQAGKPIYVHAINLTEYRRSVALRPRAIIHGLEDPVPAGDPIFRDLAAGNIIVTPTLSLFESYLKPDPRAGKALDDPIVVASVPKPVLDKLRTPGFVEESRAAFVKASNMDAYAWARKHIPIFCENVGKMHRSGVKIAVGTDGGGQVGYNFHGYNTPWEVKLLVTCGLSPMQALVAATRNGAELLGVEDRLGTVQQGKLADLIILSANPLADIENIRAIDWIIQEGRPHRRDEFAYRDAVNAR
jgi:imidazolonepropionase-like amidohydrolase